MNFLITHLLSFFLHAGTLMFAAAAPVLPAGGGSPAPAPSADPGAGGGSPSGGSQPGQGGQPGGSQPQNIDWNTAPQHLRSAFEQTKRERDELQQKFQPWQNVNVKPEQVGQFQAVYGKVYNEAASIGRQLGYPDSEIAEALAEDPLRTIEFLRDEAERAQQGGGQRDDQGNLQDLIAQHVQQAVSPIQQRENVRITNEANALFERTVHQLAVDTFKAEGLDVANIPQDEMFMLTSATSEILKYNDDALRQLKYEGKTAAIQQAFTEARTMLDKYYLARAGRDRARVQPSQRGGAPAPQGGQPGKKPTLDEIIDNPGVINDKYR